MENQDSLQLGTVNSSLPISGQQQSNLFSSNLLQPLEINLNQPGSFSDPIGARSTNIESKPVEYNQYLYESILGKSTFELGLTVTDSESPANSDNEDSLIGDATSVNREAVLNLAVTTAKEQLESFVSDEEFLGKMNLAFGDDWQPQAADALIQNLATGEAIPALEIRSAANLKANGAFGEDTIYLSEEFLSKNATNPEAVAGVLLEEIGHYVDRELSSVDSSGDEGGIFAKLVQSETIAGVELTALKAEDDSATIPLDGKEIAVELAAASEPASLEPVSIPAIENQAASTAPLYPGYNLVYDPNAPEYNEDPTVVRLWQQRMLELGYEITVDGSYGEQSKAVAIAFQQAQGLANDGIVGPDTWAATFSTSASEPAPLEPVSIPAIENQAASTTAPYPGYNLVYDPNAPEYNEDPTVVRLWQQRMLELGYEITVDGSYGEQSKAVAIAFQQAQGLANDGIVGPDTWAATFSASASEPAPLEPVSIPAIENEAASTTPTGTQSPVSGDIDLLPGFGDLNIWRYDTGGRSDPGIIEPSKETVLIIHGWNGSDQSRQIEELAKEASEDDIQVLALDWSSIAAAGLDSLPPPYNTAEWITPVAQWTQDRLEELHIDPNQLTLVGHSLGSYVSSEIAREFGKVKNLVALDPAFPGINSLLLGYDVDRNEPGQQLPADFSNVATNSLAFVASNSNPFTDDILNITSAKGGISGDSDKAASAHDSFVIQFPSGEFVNDAHSLVVDVFTDALNKGNLELLDLTLPNHEDNWYSDNGNKLNSVTSELPDLINNLLDLNHHEGRISATSTGKVEVLTRVVDSSGTEEPAWT